MNTRHRITLVLIGFGIWAAGTLVFRFSGSYLFERSAVEYWGTVISTAILCAGVSVGLMKGWRIEPQDWLQGAVCISLPGMLGEIPILLHFSELMSNMQPETAGRYAAFLFSGYLALIGLTWLMATRAGNWVSFDRK